MEENQQQVTTKEPQQVTTKEPQQVTMKDSKKVEVCKRLAAINHKKREVKKREEAKNGGMNQYYGMGSLHDPRSAESISAILAVGVIGGLGYYIYQTKKGEVPNNPPQQPRPQINKFEMD